MLDLDNLSIYPDRQAASDLFVVLRGRLKPDVAIAWDSARSQQIVFHSFRDLLEPMYAAMTTADADDKALIAAALGRLAQTVFMHGWSISGRDGRALAIVDACRRALGETVEGGDPAVADGFAPQA